MSWHELTVSQRDEIIRDHISQGEQAFLDNKEIHDCPHRSDKQEAIWWRRGFGNARLGALLDNKR